MVSKFRIGVLVIILNSLVSVTTILGQDNPSLLQMAVPSLNIAPDARGGGMGDMGAATLPAHQFAVLECRQICFYGK